MGTRRIRGKTVTTTYDNPFDICAICGQTGGSHYSDSVSWCYGDKDRERYRNDPKYQTSFSYSATDESNPNTTFKNKKRRINHGR